MVRNAKRRTWRMLPWRGLHFIIELLITCSSARHIATNGRAIEAMVRGIRAGPCRDEQVYLLGDRKLDVIATAIAAKVGLDEIEGRLERRRRQTAHDARWCLIGVGWFLALWLYEMLHSPDGFTSLGYILALIGTCAVFAVIALHCALINWQIRTRRLGTVREFLSTRDGWWPF